MREAVRSELGEWAIRPGEEGGRALRMLDASLEKSEEHALRVEAWRARLEAIGESSEPELALGLIDLLERLRQPERAFLMAVQLLEAGTWFDGWKERLEQLAESADDLGLEALVEVAESLSSNHEGTRDEKALERWRWAAQLRERLRQPGLSLAHWRRILEVAPNNREAAEALDRLASQVEDPAQLADAWESMSRTAQPEREAHSLLLKSAMARVQAGQWEAAVPMLEGLAERGEATVRTPHRCIGSGPPHLEPRTRDAGMAGASRRVGSGGRSARVAMGRAGTSEPAPARRISPLLGLSWPPWPTPASASEL